ncbi:CDP-glycerol glycerophosphotransferase (TagB/SpsB family) [Terracoccus luteus]|uniref:CDP-glycerol glycerophosphotransferase (TagB/SpsB family) n=1 Tax=Terracoccus luteus TaxID=53356 RepID=A0A495XVW6_9MICO|nr:CDP-glycerol glycerophosphotransferase family protein [Terracoccus luteus]RKT77275.1 CDP-glycerol glycerophosphotransferase (TagB/SpsB family) [Terracoccus luteus]
MTETATTTSLVDEDAVPLFSVVSAVYNVSRYLQEYLDSLEKQTFDMSRVQVVFVDDGSTDDSRAVLEEWAGRARSQVVVLHQENGGQASARNRGLEHATGEWVTFTDPDDTLGPDFFQSMADFAAEHPDVQFLSANVVLHNESTGAFARHPRWKMYEGDRLIDLDVATAYIPGSSTTSFMRRETVGDLRFNAELRPNFEDGDFAVRYLLRAPHRTTGFIGSARYFYRKRSDQSSTLQTGISVTGRYSTVPRDGYLALLREAARDGGRVPMWVQHVILYELSWYFSSEDAMGNSASAIGGSLGESFRDVLGQICDLLDEDVVDAFAIRKLMPHWRDLILHGFRGTSWHTPYVILDRYDRTKKQVRVLYRYIGEAPKESVLSRGRERAPQYGKHRAISFFGDVAMWERIMWVDSRSSVEVRLDGARMEIIAGWRGPKTRVLGARAIVNRFRRRLGPGRRASIKRLKVDPVRVLAGRGPVRQRFRRSWVLMDRIHDANDSGEILFRWLRDNRPDVNAWFTLEKDTPDWKRLKADGYGKRLVAHGSLEWKLLMLNATHLISSHIDAPIQKPPAILKHAAPRWKFSFLQHGVIKDDLSRWLNPKQIDLFVTSTSAEYDSIAGDGSPYVFTAKEVQLTGLPRFDRLHAKAKQFSGDGCDLILVAPTWRNWLVPPLQAGSQRRVIDRHFFDTEYVQQWTAFLGSRELSDLAARTGKRIAFLPHPNIQPALDDMQLPESVVRLSFDGNDVQEYFARAAVLVTDYSSMAFNAAYMDRPVVYFQFDAERVESGGHVGRAGYFTYPRDGFGPVVSDVDAAVAAVGDIAENGYTSRPQFQDRIDRTFPNRDGRCCARVTEAIEELGRPAPKQSLPPVDDDAGTPVSRARRADDVPAPDDDMADLGEVSAGD